MVNKSNQIHKKTVSKMLSWLDDASVATWYDLNLFLDKIKDTRVIPKTELISQKDFLKELGVGFAFITFDYGVDGVTIEIIKYAKELRKIIKSAGGSDNPATYFVGSKFADVFDVIADKNWKKVEIKEGGGFLDWADYKNMFHTKLERGEDVYNSLITNIWSQTKLLCEKLAKLVVKKDLKLLIPVNVNSNPGNVPLALAIVLVSEYFQIPVLNNSHDFFWEDGKPVWERKDGERSGLRDHFFKNADIGEIISIVESVFPWDSPLWFNMVLNKTQEQTLTTSYGICPANIATIPTTVDTDVYCPFNESKRVESLSKLQNLFKGKEKNLKTESAERYTSLPKDWDETSYPIFLGSEDGIPVNLKVDNFLFLHPVRILFRKRITKDFDLISQLLNYEPFQKFFRLNKKVSITLLITGPVTKEHVSYLESIIKEYNKFISSLPSDLRKRVFLAFRFGIDTNKYDKHSKPILINEIYSVANLVLLPSQQEGRGLPLIEGSACGVPVIASRYYPEDVYIETVGENLDDSMRLNIIEFPEDLPVPQKTLALLTRYLTDPFHYDNDLSHNIKVVEKRFSNKALRDLLKTNICSLHKNIKSYKSNDALVKKGFKIVNDAINYDDLFNKLVCSKVSKYTSGITELEYMVYLKSLIDPSSFRIEEKELFGRVYNFAKKMLKGLKDIPEEKIQNFYRVVANIFDYYKGNDNLVMDHSFSYRHRYSRHYPYRKLTEAELYGVVSEIFRLVIGTGKSDIPKPSSISNSILDFESSISAIIGINNVAIDHSEQLITALESKKDFAWFPGRTFSVEALVFVERTMLRRFGMKFGQSLSKINFSKFTKEKYGRVYLFVKKVNTGDSVTFTYVKNWLKTNASENIKILYKKGFLKIIKTDVVSGGYHLGQLGKTASKELLRIKEKNGFVVTVGKINTISLDLLDMHRYCFGVCNSELYANFFGLNLNEAFIMWIPPSLRPSIAYPTPLQTPKEFSDVLLGELYKKCVKKFGEDYVIEKMREDANKFGSPVKIILENIVSDNDNKNNSNLTSGFLTGLHKNGAPWSGAYAKLLLTKDGKKNYSSVIVRSSGGKSFTVLSLAEQFENKNNAKVVVGWNGGYILNPELIGKLGLSQDYIGTPLGLLIQNKKIYSLPLFNKPALVFKNKQKPDIKEANLFNGLSIAFDKSNDWIKFDSKERNVNNNQKAFFDLLYEEETIPSKGRVIYRFAGNKIIEIIKDSTEPVEIFPVGITVSFPKGEEPKDWSVQSTMKYELPGWRDVDDAVEAGPMLIRNEQESIEMEKGGWKTPRSIQTQAARVDYTHMRGPKIAVGVTAEGELLVVAINGRIRESVGSTHGELAKILLDMGAKKGMGFDPGGSTTLIVNGTQLNISPYNKDYLKNRFSLPPEPRFVGNAVLCFEK